MPVPSYERLKAFVPALPESSGRNLWELVLFVNGAEATELCAETNRYNTMERRPRPRKGELGMLWFSTPPLASDGLVWSHGGLPGRGWSVTPKRCGWMWSRSAGRTR